MASPGWLLSSAFRRGSSPSSCGNTRFFAGGGVPPCQCKGTKGDTDETARDEQGGGVRAWAPGLDDARCGLLVGQYGRARHGVAWWIGEPPDGDFHTRQAHRATAPDPLASIPKRVGCRCLR